MQQRAINRTVSALDSFRKQHHNSYTVLSYPQKWKLRYRYTSLLLPLLLILLCPGKTLAFQHHKSYEYKDCYEFTPLTIRKSL